MKPTNIAGVGNHAEAILRGWVKPAAAGDEGPPPFDLENDTGSTLAEGDVVIVKSNGKLGTTTTANYTGFVGVCLDDIDAADTGPVQFFGPIPQVNTTGSVTAGNYLITSTTAKKATQSTTRTAGTFGLITSTATNPTAFLDGGLPDFGVDTAPGAFAFTGVISPSQLTANTDDWNPTGLATAVIIRASTDASRNLTGLSGGSSGRVIVLHNVGSFDLVLKHDVTSTAANRFYCLSSADVILSANGTALLVYDATSSRWRVFSGGGGSSLTVKDEGSSLDTAVTSIDFVGGGVTATNVSHAITVTIPTASAGSSSSADSSGDVTTTSSLQDATGCSLSLVAGTWIIAGHFDVLVNNALNDRTFEGHLDSGGSDQTGIATLVAGTFANDRWEVSQEWRLTLGSTTTVKLRVKHSGGTNGDFTAKANTRIVAWMAGPAGEFATGNAKVATGESTASTSFADLATAGPSVTVSIGASGKALLHIASRADNDGDNDCYVGIVISGATTVAADTKLIFHAATGKTTRYGVTTLIEGLNSGSTTFKMQYAVAAGTGTFRARELTVAPVL